MLDPTPNYGFTLLEDDDLMSMPQLGITDNFKSLLQIAQCPQIAEGLELPNTGYHVGDKIYGPGSQSTVYICIAEDQYWGNWWKPIHAATSLWNTVPASAFLHGDWENHPTYPFKIMIDNRGRLFGQGAIHLKDGRPDFIDATSYIIMRPLPLGLRPPCNTMLPVAIDPVAMSNPAGVAALKSGRWYIRDDGTNSHRFFGGAVGTNTAWHTEMRYQPGMNDFTAP